MQLKLFQGSNKNRRFKGEFTRAFLTTDLKFTNNAEYGGVNGFKYEVIVDLHNCFDSTNCDHIKALYKAGFKLTDPWLHVEDEPDFASFDDDYGFDDALYESTNPHLDFYKSAMAFCQSKTIKSSTWEAIEESPGVFDWIGKTFDSCLIVEAGVVNYVVFDKNCILSVKPLN